MPDLWFFAGLAIGVALTGFCAIGSFERGADSAQRSKWSVELAARQQAAIASERKAHALAARRHPRPTLVAEIGRVRRVVTSRLTPSAAHQEPGVAHRAQVG